MSLVVGPVDEPLVGDRPERRRWRTPGSGPHALQEFAGGPGTVCAHKDIHAARLPYSSDITSGNWAKASSRTLMGSAAELAPLLPGRITARRISPVPLFKPQSMLAYRRRTSIPAPLSPCATLFPSVLVHEANINVDQKGIQMSGQGGRVPYFLRLPRSWNACVARGC